MISNARTPMVLVCGLVAVAAIAALTASYVAPAADEPKVIAAAPPSGSAVDPVFECYRANSAWGFVMAGAMIDRDANVYRYAITSKDPRPFFADPAAENFWSAAVLQARFAPSQRSGSIDGGTLATNVALVSKTVEGKITRSDTGVHDAGSSVCHAYVLEPSGQRYRDIVLGSDDAVADFRLVNSAPEAKTLIEWLRSAGVAN
jgi:hypothetical protein